MKFIFCPSCYSWPIKRGAKYCGECGKKVSLVTINKMKGKEFYYIDTFEDHEKNGEVINMQIENHSDETVEVEIIIRKEQDANL